MNMGITSGLTDRLKDVKSWNSLEIPSEEINFRNYGIQAITELGQDGVPFFNGPKHQIPGFTGFVRHLNVYGETTGMYLNVLEEADFAYIEGGKIRYTQKDNSNLSVGEQRKVVSWRDGNFRIDEQYGGSGFPRNNDIALFDRIRTAEFIDEDQAFRIEVTQDHTGKLKFRLDEYNDRRKKYGYGLCGAVEIEVEKSHPQYERVVKEMQAKPDLFADSRNAASLLQGIEIHHRSNIYDGFKDGEYGKAYAPNSKVITGTLKFEDALKIAFPKLAENGPQR